MALIKNIAVEKLEQAEHVYLVYSAATRHPFIRYEAATGKDQITAFPDPVRAEELARELERYGYVVSIADVPRESRLTVFTNYHALGIDQVAVRDEHSVTTLDLTEIAPLDLSRLPAQQRPTLNPALQLTCSYFLQEMTRRVPEENLTEEDRRARFDLEEEFSRNLAVSRYMVPVQLNRVRTDAPGTRVSPKNVEHVFVTDSHGAKWLPVMSDVTEFESFNKEGKFQAVLMDLVQIRRLTERGFSGAVLNPAGQAYRLLPRAMELLTARYQQ